MKKTLLCLILLLSITQLANAQVIEFEYKNSLRIPYNKVRIIVSDANDEYSVRVITSPLKNDEKWKYSKKYYTRNISKESFVGIFKLFLSFYKSYFPSKTDYSGADGSTWTLSMGSYIDKIKIEAWSPYDQTQKRGLKEFVNICETLVRISGLPFEEVLHQ